MGRSDDITSSLAQRSVADVGYHQGVIRAWNRQTGDNVIDVVGTPITNVPMLNITEALVLRVGHVVGLLRYKTSYFILGRIVIPGSADFFSGVMPDISEAFYQQNTDAVLQTNTLGAYTSKLVSAMIINHPKVAVGGKVQVSGGTATGQARVQWYTAYPTNAASPPGGTLMATSGVYTTTTGTPGVVWGPIDYAWPAGMYGQLVFVSYEIQLITGTAGVDWASVVPTAFYGHGD